MSRKESLNYNLRYLVTAQSHRDDCSTSDFTFTWGFISFFFSFPHRWKGIMFFSFRVCFCKVAHHVRRVINQGWGRYSRKEKALTKHKLESSSRRRSREELRREQQANIFNLRDHAGRLIRTPPPLITGLFTRLHYMWRQYQLARLWKSNEIW